MQIAVMTFILLTGAISEPQTVATDSAPGALLWHEQPAPLHRSFSSEPKTASYYWKRTIQRRQWIPRYTIHDGTHFARPHDYQRAFDYPWHAPHASRPHLHAAPQIVPIEPVAPPVLPLGEELYPDPAIAPHP